MTYTRSRNSLWLGGIAVLCTLVLGCGGDDPPEYDTIGDFVGAMAGVLCEKLDECDQLQNNLTVEQCTTMFKDLVCAESGCADPVPDDVSDEEIQDCIDDVDDLSCPVSQSSPIPASCELAMMPTTLMPSLAR
jgi:hypothetical protein